MFQLVKRFGGKERVHWMSARKVSSYPLIVNCEREVKNREAGETGPRDVHMLRVEFFHQYYAKRKIKLTGKFNCRSNVKLALRSGYIMEVGRRLKAACDMMYTINMCHCTQEIFRSENSLASAY